MKKARPKGNWHTKRTFIALDVPAPLSESITALRRRFGSWRAALPVEITLAGSSGLGVLRYHESELESVFATLNQIAREYAPIVTRFTAVKLFPGTRVFYFAPHDAAPFVALQAALVKSDLRFESSPHPFTPHCTIADLEFAALELPADLRNLALPANDIVLDSLSVTLLDARILGGDAQGCRLLHRTRLGFVPSERRALESDELSFRGQ